MQFLFFQEHTKYVVLGLLMGMETFRLFSVRIYPDFQERSKIAIASEKSLYSAKQLTI